MANGQFYLAFGALLLAATNILAIQLTNALVLWFAGFRRIDIDKSHDDAQSSKVRQILIFMKRNFISLGMLLVLSAYLGVNFRQNMQQQRYESSVSQVVANHISEQTSRLIDADFGLVEKPKLMPITQRRQYLIEVRIQGVQAPSVTDVEKMQDEIEELTNNRFKDGRNVRLQLRFIPEQLIESR